jgi:hypothetical protein
MAMVIGGPAVLMSAQYRMIAAALRQKEEKGAQKK